MYRHKSKIKFFFVVAVTALGMLTACGREKNAENRESTVSESNSPQKQTEEADAPQVPLETKEDTPDNLQTDVFKEMFGQDCISEQTFEVELSEYEGKVYFVPFAPQEKNGDFRMQIIREGEVLREITGYVPESLSGEAFTSLDAVFFYDVNYDGQTDIVLVETYGHTRFAAIYYGYYDDYGEYGISVGFMAEERLSENITARLEEITVSKIRDLLGGGKKNGEFADYREAYDAVSSLFALEAGEGSGFNLIYVDEDDTPELITGHSGYYISMYTYDNGSIYLLMDHWAYGAMGNAGYEYASGKNSLRNYNADYAGAILYTTYMTVGSGHAIEIVAEIKEVNFDDANENGSLDEEEYESAGNYGETYINGKEATYEECEVYDMGPYEYITPSMSLEELRAKLNEG